ncbi:hypothetical protein BGZ61DRAFT_374933, partial [Ilyonectria robusta]|uniref:uncharacterized protein n=1 Tax=Ilyonectria robusta TaxID=1079257 RepID=UPI001E8CFB3F
NFPFSMSASITGEYRINRAAGARVDYAIFVNPDYDTGVQVHDAIERLQRAMPEKSVNHTAFFPIRNRPISVSIETKRASSSQDKALLQIGIWQSSQWKLLANLAGPEAVQKLPFIPGIVVEGYDWKLAATTIEGQKTALYTKILLGTTETPLGIYFIVAAL